MLLELVNIFPEGKTNSGRKCSTTHYLKGRTYWGQQGIGEGCVCVCVHARARDIYIQGHFFKRTKIDIH